MTEEHPIHYDKSCKIKERDVEKAIKKLDLVIGDLSYGETSLEAINIQNLKQVKEILIESHPDY